MTLMQSPPGAETVVDGRRYLYFGGTGYLGLQGDPEVIRAACEAAEQYGLGSATARSGFGNTPPILELERQAALFFDTADAFHVMSGYVANHVLVLACEGCFETIFLDEFSHYSIREAAQLSGRKIHTFRHRDPEDLRCQLRLHLPAHGRPLVMTDGVFAALGRIAPAGNTETYWPNIGAILAIDDAHGLGVRRQGRGTYEHAGLFRGQPIVAKLRDVWRQHLLACGTLSKAAGGFGGIVPGSRTFVSDSKRRAPITMPPARRFHCSGHGPRVSAYAPAGLRRLRENVRMVKSGLRQLGLHVDATPVPIIPLTIGTAENMQRLTASCENKGF